MRTSAKPKAYSYIRFSTLEQAKGDSLARQLKLSKDYAEKHGLQLDESLSMRDLGLSGFKKANLTKGALGGFVSAVEKGLVPKGSLLLVESLDRISRAELTEQMDLFISLVKRGITIVTLADGMSYSKESINRQMSELVISLTFMSRGYEESAMKSRRLKSAWAAKREQVCNKILTARCPAWLAVDKANNKFIPIEERCDVVRRIFQMTASGVGKTALVKRLNSEKVKPFGRGNGWHSSYIQKILQNRSVLGEFQTHKLENGKRVPEGEVIKDYFPRIISDELFFQAMNRRSTNSTLVGRGRCSTTNLFSGLLKCGYTGASVTFVNKGKWQYLVADNARRGLVGTYLSWPYQDFETSFFAFLEELSFSELLDDDWRIKREQVAAEISRELEEERALRKQLENLVNAIAGGIKPDSVLSKITSIEQQLKEKETRVAALQKEEEKQQQVQKDSEEVEQKTRSLMARRNEPEVREQLRQEIRRQVEKITMFAGGPKDGLHGFHDMFFAHIGGDTPLTAEDLKRPEVQDAIVAKLNERINDRRSSDEIPNDRKRRFFKVHFKTGAEKLVMPAHGDPTKFQRLAWVSEEKNGEIPSIKVRHASGIGVSVTWNKKRK